MLHSDIGRGGGSRLVRRKSKRQWIESLERRLLLSSAHLLVDENDATPDSNPNEFVSFGGNEYFFATLGTSTAGEVLEKTDGTAAGTSLVKSLGVPDGAADLQVDNSLMSFTTPTTSNGPRQLWVSDGTPGGTFKVASLPASAAPYAQHNFYPFGGFTLFAANDGSHDGLWRTNDGGAPTLIKSISVESSFVTLGGVAYFAADDGQSGQELWKTDGTSDGTSMVTSLAPAGQSAQIAGLAVVNGLLYFTASPSPALLPGLWTSDGTSAGTQEIAFQVGEGVGAGGLYYYMDLFTRSLWRTDGTTAGTFPLGQANNLGPSYLGTVATRLTAFNDLLIFVGVQQGTGSELWRSDGTDAGTYLLKDISPGWQNFWNGDSTKRSTSEFLAIGNTFYFNANNQHGIELWKTDGTSDGTSMVRDINPGGSSSPNQFTNLNGKLLFCADDDLHGMEPWISDGSDNGTSLVADVNNFGLDSNPDHLVNLGGRVLFSATDDSHHEVLYATDGTAQGTVPLLTLGPATEPTLSAMSAIATDGKVAYFVNRGSNGAATLFITDGTAAGTHACGGGFNIGFRNQKLAILNGKCFYIAGDSPHGYELWVSDGQTSSLFVDINPGVFSAFNIQDTSWMSVYGGALWFVADDGVHGAEVWTSDGTVANTHMVKDLSPGSEGSGANSFAYFKGRLFFSAGDGVHGTELCSSDGTSAGTKIVADLVAGSTGSGPRDLTVAGNWLFCSAEVLNAYGYARQFIRSDGTTGGTIVLKSARGGLDPQNFINDNGILYFDVHGYPHQGIWRSDGTAAGTFEIYPAVADNLPLSIFQAVAGNGKLFFYGTSQGLSRQNQRSGLWESNGTAAGTYVVPGLPANTPGGLNLKMSIAAANGTMFFHYSDDAHGNEMWILPPGSAPGKPVGLKLTISSSEAATENISVQWTDGNDMNGYLLERSTDASFSHIDATFTVPANYDRFSDTVPTGADYYYRLIAYNPHGNSPAATASTTGSIAGAVFNDANSNGKRDTGEAGIASVRVYLDQNANGIFDASEKSVLTDSTGAFKLTDVTAGTFDLREVEPSGYKLIAPSTGVIHVTLAAGQSLTGQNFADAKIPPKVSISGTVYNDANGDALRQSTEKGLAGWKLYLDTNNNGKLDTGEPTTLSDSLGNYTFANLVAGTYHVRDVLQSSWRATGASSYTLALTTANATAKNFAVSQTAKITGTVFKDANHDGVFDTGDSGLAGWRVFVDTNNDGIWESTEMSVLSAANGTFTLTLAAGTYHLRVVTKTGFTRTEPAAGSYTPTAAKGQVLTGKNFGYR